MQSNIQKISNLTADQKEDPKDIDTTRSNTSNKPDNTDLVGQLTRGSNPTVIESAL